MERVFNIINRARKEFGFEYDMDDTLQDILNEAFNAIDENVEYDRIEVCETNRHYSHVSWSDGKGYDYEADGEFISGNDRKNTYFRKANNGSFLPISWYEHTDEDYVLMDVVFDTDGQKVALVCK